MTRLPIVQTTDSYFSCHYKTDHKYDGRYNYYCNVNEELFYEWFHNEDFAEVFYLLQVHFDVKYCLKVYEMFGLKVAGVHE